MVPRILTILIPLMLCVGIGAQNYTALPIDVPGFGGGQVLPKPFGHYPSSLQYDEVKSHHLIPACYLPNAGQITALQVSGVFGTPEPYTLLEIRLAHTTLSTLSTTFANNLGNPAGGQLVYSIVNGTMSYPRNQWTTLAFKSPFRYDGVSNLTIEIRKIVDRSSVGTKSYEYSWAIQYPYRTDLPQWVYAFGTGAVNAATASNTYTPGLLLRLEWLSPPTLLVSGTRIGSGGNYWRLTANLSITTQAVSGSVYWATIDFAKRAVPIVTPPIGGNYWLPTLFLLYTGLSGIPIGSTGQHTLTFTIPNVPALVGQHVYLQNAVYGPPNVFDWTNVADLIIQS